MTSRSTYRGHKIEEIEGEWRFEDTHEPTVGSKRPCGHCGEDATAEGHDACLRTLPGVMNACCGHGDVRDAYVQMPNGTHLKGWDAVIAMRKLQRPADGNRIDHLEWPSTPTPTRSCWFQISSDWYAGTWHAWARDHTEYDVGPGHFPVGVIEDESGHMHSVPIKKITFASKSGDTMSTIRGKLAEYLTKCGLLPEVADKIIDAYRDGPLFPRNWRTIFEEEADVGSGSVRLTIMLMIKLGVRAEAVKWIDANQPEHFARAFFASV